jgi:hypothetical protein
MLDQFAETEDALIARRMSWVCSICSCPVGTPDHLVQLADLAVKDDMNTVKDPIDADMRFLSAKVRGLAAYRVGDWESALNWCSKSRANTDEHEHHVQNLLIEAMALHQLKKTSQAKAAFDEGMKLARQIFPTAVVDGEGAGSNWRDWIAIELLRREAGALLEITEPSE